MSASLQPAPGPGDGGGGLVIANPDVLCGSGGDVGDNECGGGGGAVAPGGPGLRPRAGAVAVAVAVAVAAAVEAAAPVPGGGGRRDAAATGEKSDRATGLGERRGTPPPAGDLGAHRTGGGGSCWTDAATGKFIRHVKYHE